MVDGLIPFEKFAGVELLNQKGQSGRDGLRVDATADAAFLSVGSRTDVLFRLCDPHSLSGLHDPSRPVTTIHIATEEPERLVGELEQRLAPVS